MCVWLQVVQCLKNPGLCYHKANLPSYVINRMLWVGIESPTPTLCVSAVCVSDLRGSRGPHPSHLRLHASRPSRNPGLQEARWRFQMNEGRKKRGREERREGGHSPWCPSHTSTGLQALWSCERSRGESRPVPPLTDRLQRLGSDRRLSWEAPPSVPTINEHPEGSPCFFAHHLCSVTVEKDPKAPLLL